MLWLLVLALGLAWLLLWRRSRRLRALRGQFKSDYLKLPLFGDSHHFIGGGERRMSAIMKFSRQAIKYNGWTSFQMGPLFYGAVADPLETEYIMKTHLEKDDIFKIARGLIGDGLVFASVPIWRPRRKVMALAFSQNYLNMFADIFYQQNVTMGNKLSHVADHRPVSIWQYITSYAMDAICQSTLGIDIEVQKTADHEVMRHFQQYASIMAARVFYPWIQNETSFKYLCYFGWHSQIKKCIKTLKDFVNAVIKNKREEIKRNQVNNLRNNDKEKAVKRDLKPILELLIEASGGANGYSDEELREESLVVLLAGTDTSAVGSAFTTLMLSRHPSVQEKAYQEIYELFGDTDRPIRADDLNRLRYLEAVVKESLRLYPPVPVTIRKVVKEDVTPAGIQLAPGMGIVICHWAINRNPKYWGQDAEDFRPERFFDSPPSHPAAFASFAAGPRNCLGYKYAMMSIMTTATSLLRRFRLLPLHDQEVDKPLRVTYEVMMKHADNFQLRLEPRT